MTTGPLVFFFFIVVVAPGQWLGERFQSDPLVVYLVVSQFRIGYEVVIIIVLLLWNCLHFAFPFRSLYQET